MVDNADNNSRHYLVLVERISRLERDMSALIAQVDRANDALQEARSDVRTARLETQTARSEIRQLIQELKEANIKLDKAQQEIAGLRTTLKILVGVIVAGFLGIVGLMLQTFAG